MNELLLMNEISHKKLDVDPAEWKECASEKSPFEEPKLAFIEPKLTPRGDLREVTGFFGGFSP